MGQGANKGDPGSSLLPLVYQQGSNTTVLEQPLDFTHLAEKYNAYVTGFIQAHATVPFFLYMPFSHVHTTAGDQPDEQYAKVQPPVHLPAMCSRSPASEAAFVQTYFYNVCKLMCATRFYFQ